MPVMTLHHGTDGANAASIISHGLNASTSGRLGPGVYLTPDKGVAKSVAKYRGLQFVVTCQVDVGSVKDLGNDSARDGGWRRHYDTAKSQHPAWALKYGERVGRFPEYCVSDPSRVRVVAVSGIVAEGVAAAANAHGSNLIVWVDSAKCHLEQQPFVASATDSLFIVWVDSAMSIDTSRLTNAGFEVKTFNEVNPAMQYLQGRSCPACVITSMMESGGRAEKGLPSGLKLADFVRAKFGSKPLLAFVTNSADEQMVRARGFAIFAKGSGCKSKAAKEVVKALK